MRTIVLGYFALASMGFSFEPLKPIGQRQVLAAICFVESGGREDCPDGDGGRSIGPFQISRHYWRDALDFEPSIGGAYSDCRKRDYAERVVRAYMRRYIPAAWKAADAHVIARTHNGGPDGARKAGTLSYWWKVRKALLERAGR